METTSHGRGCLLEVTRIEGRDVGKLQVQYSCEIEGVLILFFQFSLRSKRFCPFLCIAERSSKSLKYLLWKLDLDGLMKHRRAAWHWWVYFWSWSSMHSALLNKLQHHLLLFFLNWFIYFWLCWVFVSVQELSPVAASGGHSSSRCAGLSLLRPLLLRSTGSRRAGSVVVAHGPSRSAACGIFPDRGTNPCPLHWQADS